MTRTFFRSCRVHSCHDQLLGDPKPKRCNCRKLVSMHEAQMLVEYGTADWLLNYKTEPPSPLWDVVLRGRTTKTPRAHTLESYNPARAPHSFGQIERTIDRSMSDEGRLMNWVERAAQGEEEEKELFNVYADLEMQLRYELFGDVGNELKELKKLSDTFGTRTGQSAIHLDRDVFAEADRIKYRNVKPDPFEGAPILSLIGTDQRT